MGIVIGEKNCIGFTKRLNNDLEATVGKLSVGDDVLMNGLVMQVESIDRDGTGRCSVKNSRGGFSIPIHSALNYRI
jgi:hypothetical protein